MAFGTAIPRFESWRPSQKPHWFSAFRYTAIPDTAEQTVYLRRTRVGTGRALDDSTALAAQEAADALVALGWPVIPAGDDMDRWAIGDFELTDDELIGLATRRGIQPSQDQVH